MLRKMLSDRPIPKNAARSRIFLRGHELLEQEERVG